MKFDHIGADDYGYCLNCGHHHCKICGECHRCGCADFRTTKKARLADIRKEQNAGI